MRYAVTFTTDDTWNTTDTLILETDVSPLDMDRQQLVTMFETYFGGDTEMAEQVVSEPERWFLRNLGDTDVNMVGQ